MGLKVGQKAPDFTLPSHLGQKVRLSELRGHNVVLAFFPMAWTPVWTNQIPAYEADKAKFAESNAQVLGISVDHVPCLTAWAESLGGISYPLLSDFWPHGSIAGKYGVLRSKEGRSERALFIIDKEGIIRYIDIHDIDDQPDNDVLLTELRRIDPQAAAAAARRTAAEKVELPHGGIVMYCNNWCPTCKKARAWLEARNLPYREVNIPNTPGAADQVRLWTNGNVTSPTFDIDGTIVVDFNEQKLAEALKQANLLK